MPRSGPDHPPWLAGEGLIEAEPLDKPFDPLAPERYLMACTVSGRKEVFMIRWRARDLGDAEATFADWLSQGWAVISKSFLGQPCRYVFRTGAVSAFFVLPDQRFG